MLTRAFAMALLLLSVNAARADFSIICDEIGQIEDILRTTEAKGFHEAKQKMRAYAALRDERNEPTCAVSRPLFPANVVQVVASFESIEFLPSELHQVLVVELHMQGRVLFGTINRYVTEKKAETGI
jgi:hypothetical protein